MTNQEIDTIRNIIARLKKRDCGCSHSFIGPDDNNALKASVEMLNERDIECVARIYLDTWVIGALECLLPESRDPATAVALSRP